MAGRGGFAAWLLRIASNLCVDTLAARGKVTVGLVVDSGPICTGPGPEDVAIEREDSARLRSLVVELPGPQREVVLLKYAAGLANPEIAAATGRSVTAGSSLLHRATTKLKERLDARP
ncbi:MAG: sigma-70 family RNA polymerase sigma factor [Bacillota bacterium]